MEKQTVEVVEYTENDDGGATVVFDMDEDTVNAFVRQGMRIALEDLTDKYVIVSPEEWEEWSSKLDIPEPRKYELSSQEIQGFFQIGTLAAIKKGVNEVLDDTTN